MGNKKLGKNAQTELPPEFYDLVSRTYEEKPNPKDVQKLVDWLEKSPEIWWSVFDLSFVVRTSLVIRLLPNRVVRSSVEKNVSEIKRGMNYDSASTLEKLLIDNVIITWLRLELLEYQEACIVKPGDVRPATADFWDKRLSASQRHHLQACETLARVRRLLSNNPLLQVNIATQSGQQMNFAGNLLKKQE